MTNFQRAIQCQCKIWLIFSPKSRKSHDWPCWEPGAYWQPDGVCSPLPPPPPRPSPPQSLCREVASGDRNHESLPKYSLKSQKHENTYTKLGPHQVLNVCTTYVEPLTLAFTDGFSLLSPEGSAKLNRPGRGAHRPVLHVNEHKKPGAHCAWARRRGQNPLFLIIFE